MTKRVAAPARNSEPSDQRLHFFNPGGDGGLSRFLLVEGVVKEELIFLVAGEAGPIQKHDGHEDDGQDPDG